MNIVIMIYLYNDADTHIMEIQVEASSNICDKQVDSYCV